MIYVLLGILNFIGESMMSDKYELVEKGVDYLECPNCLEELYLPVEYIDCLYQQGKVYHSCGECGTGCKVYIIKNMVWIR